MSFPLDTPSCRRAMQVKPLDNYCLKVWLADGAELILDMGPLIHQREAYWRLRQERYFRQADVDPLGGICWPEGEDLAPEGLERYRIADPIQPADQR